MPAPPVAPRLHDLLAPLAGGTVPAHLVAWDGSTAGADPAESPTVRICSPQALRRLMWAPGELGAAQAFVTGEVEVDGDLGDALAHVRDELVRRQPRPSPAERAKAIAGLGVLAKDLGLLGARPAPPASQAVVKGRLHSLGRDRAAISHHYDLSNDFYELILDSQMAYSCGYVTQDGADLVRGREDEAYTLEQAQFDKLELVCTKLGLHTRPDQRFVDVGCGWGSLTLHAAREHGARVVAVTISREQQAFVQARAQEQGVADRVDVRLQDYREVPESDFDAVASIEMGEHVGDKNYRTYASTLHRLAAPGAHVLVQQMSRPGKNPGGGPFIESFIAPDMSMRPVGTTIELLERAGLELRGVQALREHYAWTIRSWEQRLRERRADVLALVGEEVTRVWELYLAGGAWTFASGRMGVDQLLLRRSG
ncbi:class I SAM-dependent methyltransferase [Serinicoccus kebangsaanensis]|uniref:class I SAM-dependent methyltransferase n=1 Tax=Serinicoccus kebangsaanensis TaxID=2602069 RepID=UPI00124DE970|nr:class I SAM-dependent methyltransferase [Serinicoccus kebangsaanensis]